MDQTTTFRVEQPISFGTKLREEESQQQVQTPHAKLLPLRDGQTWGGIVEPTQFPLDKFLSYGDAMT